MAFHFDRIGLKDRLQTQLFSMAKDHTSHMWAHSWCGGDCRNASLVFSLHNYFDGVEHSSRCRNCSGHLRVFHGNQPCRKEKNQSTGPYDCFICIANYICVDARILNSSINEQKTEEWIYGQKEKVDLRTYATNASCHRGFSDSVPVV